jgi:signal transduction histidine kinase
MGFIDSVSEERWLLYLDNLTHLLSARSLRELLAEALALMVNEFRASGGSILYSSMLTEHVRQGDLSAAARQRIDRIEGITVERARLRPLQIQLPRSPPVTRQDLPDGQGTLLSIPLIIHDRIHGVLSLYFDSASELHEQRMQTLSALTSSISAVASNVEQISITRQRLGQIGLFYQMGQAMASTFDLDHLFQDTIDLAISVIDAQQATLMLLDRDRRQLRVQVSLGKAGHLDAQVVKPGQGITGWVAEHGEPLVANDPEADERYDPEVDCVPGHVLRSLVAVPLQFRGRTIGVLRVCNKVQPFDFDEEDLSVLITLAAQVSIALENARLYNSLRVDRDRIIEAQEKTRHELARNLHDGPVQLLATIAMEIDYLERLIQARPSEVPEQLDALRRLLRHATQDARMLLFELRPVILETQGLVPALESYVERLSENSSFALHFDAGEFQNHLRPAVAGTIFSIVQEAVNNIEKHAEADNVWIRLREEGTDLVVSVEDDGRGFDLDAVVASYDQGTSFGLLNMRERAELIDGVLSLQSGPGGGREGTLVQLRVDLAGT